MPVIHLVALALPLVLGAQAERIIMHIPTSDAIRIAKMIARAEGYDIKDHKIYYFDSLDAPDPLLRGYVSIGFYINGSIRSTISISTTTGQALDMNSCEIFDYPDLRPFQQDIMRLSKAKKKTPQQLADDAGCSSPRVLTKPVSAAKQK